MIEDLLYFTKKERRQFFILILLIISLIIILLLDKYSDENISAQFSFVEAIEKIKTEGLNKTPVKTALQLKPFDPNQVSQDELRAMGLPKRGIKSLLNYRKSGGRIKNLTHFKKMYGFEDLEDDVLDAILLFPVNNKNENADQRPISLRLKNQNSTENQHENEDRLKDTIHQSYWKKTNELEKDLSPMKIHINTADTTELKALFGIGSYRAKRIINFRNALGGFHNIEQLYDTHGVPDSIINSHVDKFVIDTTEIQKIKINEATIDTLAKHPLISWQEAKLIYNYRQEHGDFSHVNDLFAMYGLDSVTVIRLLPYLTTNI